MIRNHVRSKTFSIPLNASFVFALLALFVSVSSTQGAETFGRQVLLDFLHSNSHVAAVQFIDTEYIARKNDLYAIRKVEESLLKTKRRESK